jgi:hypothetical protein
MFWRAAPFHFVRRSAFLLTGPAHDGQIMSMAQMVIGDVVICFTVAANLVPGQWASCALGA